MENNSAGLVSGYASIVGRPNVGKSTLLNNFASMRLAIVSPKPQTTRHNIKYIHDDETSQIVFTDTPGMHTPRTRLGERMMEQAVQALKDADVVLLIIDATNPKVTDTERNCCEVCAKFKKPVILLINKCDLVEKEKLLPIIARYSELHAFAEIIPISAIKKDGIDRVLDTIKSRLPEGPRYYPEDTLTDQTEREISSELIREQILRYTSEELPHGTAVEIEKFKEIIDGEDEEDGDAAGERSLVKISAIIFCEKDSHKKMLIGKQGEMIKRIGIGARKGIEELLQCKVHLELFVKVRKDWRNDTNVLSELGYSSKND
ncbi:MAG: GTPase Era [Saccharofermentanales bacterium]